MPLLEYKSLSSEALSKRVSGHAIPLTQKSPLPFNETQQIPDLRYDLWTTEPVQTENFYITVILRGWDSCQYLYS